MMGIPACPGKMDVKQDFSRKKANYINSQNPVNNHQQESRKTTPLAKREQAPQLWDAKIAAGRTFCILPAATLLAYFFSDPIAPVIRTAPEITASSIRMKERMNGTPSAPMVDVPPKISTRSSMRKLISVTR